MILLQTHRLSKSFAGTQILSDVALEIQEKERVGLVGANGAGKSTLLKIITGEDTYDEGDIFQSKQATMGYLAQDTGLDTAASIYEEMQQVYAQLIEEEQRLRQMEKQMAQPDILTNEQQYAKILDDYAQRSEAFKIKGGYEYEARIHSVLNGLGFNKQQWDAPISTLSGGQKTRLALGKLLLQRPDLLILDEPTNYLDLETLDWLEQYLLHYPGALLIVSHDRYFLDKLTTMIYEIERTRCTKYVGNYSSFLSQKEEERQRLWKEYEKQQKEIKETEDFIQRNIARDSTSNRAKSRRKALEKMDLLERPDPPLKKASFSFEVDRTSGKDVLQVKQLAIGYEKNRPLAQNLSFQAYRGDRIAIIGPNGSGKTTLLKTIYGHIPPLDGQIDWGAHVSISFYDQEQGDLQGNHTVLDEIWNEHPHMLQKDVRSLLGQFLFSGEDVYKQINDLSGGERARVSIAKMMLERNNVLMLDEPTNHLDLNSKEVLEQALLDYPGTILFVSHDRYFLNQMATKVLELTPDDLKLYLGNFDYYKEKKQEQQAIHALHQQDEEHAHASASHANRSKQEQKKQFELEKEKQREQRKRQRKLETVEQQMQEQEQKVEALETELYQPKVYADYEKAQEVQEQLDTKQQKLDQLLEEWLSLAESSSSVNSNRK